MKIRDTILFITYKACRSWYTKNDPYLMYRGAIGLIQLFVIIHVIQLFVVFYKGSWKQLTIIEAIVLIAFIFLLGFFLEKIFPKKNLPRVLETHEGSNLGKYSKLIIYTYLLLNFLILILIVFIRR